MTGRTQHQPKLRHFSSLDDGKSRNFDHSEVRAA
jgi:hypothetical protein